MPVPRFIFAIGALILSGAAAKAQPTIAAVVNAASNAVRPMPNVAIARGAMFVVYGTGLGPATLAQATTYPLPAVLAGTSARISFPGAGGAPQEIIMVYTSATQICGILRSDAPTGMGSMTVTYNNQTSATFPVVVVANNFGTFSLSQNGQGEAIATYPDYSLVTYTKAANPGETLILWGTGGGAVTGNESAGALPGDQPSWPMQVYVGGKLATIVYRGRSGCCAGLDQVAFVVPAGVSGCTTPLTVTSGPLTSNTTTLAVAPSGRSCTHGSSQFTASALQRWAANGQVMAAALQLQRGQVDNGFSVETRERAEFSFARILSPMAASPEFLESLPSLGSCLVRAYKGDPPSSTANVRTEPLDAGPGLTITGPLGSRTLSGNGFYLGAGTNPEFPFLDSGLFTIRGPGGAAVGPFTTSIRMPSPFAWTNASSTSVIPRTAPLQIDWSGGDPAGYVVIEGRASQFVPNTPDRATITFRCATMTTDGTFRVPAYVLASLPPALPDPVTGRPPLIHTLRVTSFAAPVGLPLQEVDGSTTASTYLEKAVAFAQ